MLLGEGFEFVWSVPTDILGVSKTYCVALLEMLKMITSGVWTKVKDTDVIIVSD